MQRPSAHTAVFHREMRDLWRGVVLDTAAAARPAFFPVRAYVQIKAIADPRGDWRLRLFDFYRLDLGAAHSLLGSGASTATFRSRTDGRGPSFPLVSCVTLSSSRETR